MTRLYVQLLGPCFKTGRIDVQQAADQRCTSLSLTHLTRDQSAPPSTARQSSATCPSPAKQQAPSKDAYTVNRSPIDRSWSNTRGVTNVSSTHKEHPWLPPRALGTSANWSRLPYASQKYVTTTHKRPGRSSPVARQCLRPTHCKPPKLNPTSWLMWLYPLTSRQFHVLLNSLFKVLFNFPSRYLFAIGLVLIFSLRWSLPPTLGCTPKQPDSRHILGTPALEQLKASHPLWGTSPVKGTLSLRPAHNERAKHRIVRRPCDREPWCWAYPTSLAVTMGIPVGFFSSAY
jgi:hypothetical protein